jgi:glyoxylase-like metal-dependent hydrolase (beta-lactamase superfamily II)
MGNPGIAVGNMEIKNGVHLLDGIRGANSYLFITEDGILVIDTGMPGNAERILSQIKALNKTAKEIKVIILTHSDIDHSGSAAIHGGDAPGLSGEKGPKRVKGFIGAIFRLMARFMRFQTIKPDIILKDGDEIDHLRVIHTPGHTEGSICLYKTDDILFAGDAVRTDSRGNLKLSPAATTLNVQQALESARKIAGLEFDILLPGHGAPAIGKASTKLKELLAQTK